jgi:hypothetical protein
MGPQTIVPAHGSIGDGSLIQTLRTIMSGIVTRTRELKADGQTADQIAMTLQMEFQQQHPMWPRANGVAAIARVAYDNAP